MGPGCLSKISSVDTGSPAWACNSVIVPEVEPSARAPQHTGASGAGEDVASVPCGADLCQGWALQGIQFRWDCVPHSLEARADIREHGAGVEQHCWVTLRHTLSQAWQSCGAESDQTVSPRRPSDAGMGTVVWTGLGVEQSSSRGVGP